MIPYIMVEPKQWSEMIQAMEENARLKAEVERLEQQVNYWRIEAETDNARWLRCLKDLEAVRKMGDAMLFFIEKKTHAQVYAMIAKEWKEAKEGNQP